jgi:cyanophycinase
MSFEILAEGVVVIAGGGPEGDIGVKTDWSYALYKKLVENGDVTGDKKIKVVVVSLEKPDTNFIADYFKSMGADQAVNLVVDSKKKANEKKIDKILEDADVVFFRGGNQGNAYQWWKETKLHDQIRKLSLRGGAIGGTSSGAMGLAEYSITGGQDFDTRDVLTNSKSPLLNDKKDPKTSAVHTDFLNLVPGAIIDTHCGERGRIGRLLAVQAKTIEDSQNKKILGICLEEKTGVVIKDGKAEVFGTGTVHFLQETDNTIKLRQENRPLGYTSIRDDALTEGWIYKIEARLPDIENRPKSAIKIEPELICSDFDNKNVITGKKSQSITTQSIDKAESALIFHDAQSDGSIKDIGGIRGVIQTKALFELYNKPSSSIILFPAESEFRGVESTSITQKEKIPEISSMILDCQYCFYKSKSSFVSNQDDGSLKLHSAGFVNMRIHVLNSKLQYDLSSHEAQLNNKSETPLLGIIKCNESSSDALSTFQKLKLDEDLIVKKLNCKK